MKKRHIALLLAACTWFLTCAVGCAALGFTSSGSIVPIAEPGKEARAKAIVQYNKATELLVAARDRVSGKINAVRLDKALAAYKEAERLSPNYADTQMQLGIIYEFFKEDERTAYAYYKKYKALGGTDKEILAAIRELERKFGRGGGR